MVNKSIKKIKYMNNNSKYFTLTGDKVYKTQSNYKLNNKLM